MKNLKKTLSAYAVSGILLALTMLTMVSAHCEIPCGIYDDQLRTKLIAEHTATIEKSMKEIIALSSEKPVNYNQLVRWISNKEHHATEIQQIVSQYFMTQRIKPDQVTYQQSLQTLHELMIVAMKCKQTTDLSHIDSLRSLLQKFESLYFHHDRK